jgi:pimeloyl-ACP methyl ester carboxylesterase
MRSWTSRTGRLTEGASTKAARRNSRNRFKSDVMLLPPPILAITVSPMDPLEPPFPGITNLVHRYWRRLLLGCGLIALLVWVLDPLGWRQPAQAAGLVESACWFKAPDTRKVDCFYLYVPETRAISLRPPQAGKTRFLKLPVVIVRGQAADDQAVRSDPVVYLSGGPGDGAWIDAERIEWWWDFIAENAWLATRDVVLFEQRGSGLAAGDMDCPEAPETALEWLGLDEAGARDLNHRATQACAMAVKAMGHDATAYTTRDNAEDLHALFQSLQQPRWNVYGLSYGTRLALEYMRQHPADIRSVILDSVLPPQVQFYEDDAANTDRAFQYLLATCGTTCDLSYPDLGARFLALVERLNQTPLIVERPHPAGDGKVTVRMDGNRLIYRLFGLLYNVPDIESVPYLIDIYDRDLRDDINADIDRYLWEVHGREDFGDAMFLSVQCFEEMPFNDTAKAIAAYDRYPLLRGLTDSGEAQTYSDICGIWRNLLGAPAARPSDNAAVSSDVPTLILTGSFDPVTPPAYARLAAETLPNSFLFEFPYLGHDVLGNDDCPNVMATEFLDQLTVDPAHYCAKLHVPLSFVLPKR